MKTLSKISFLLVFFIMNVNAQDAKIVEETLTVSHEGVVAIHKLELLPGVDAKAFEAFVLAEIVPIYDKMKGQKSMLVKGDRGERKGQYAFNLIVDSIEDRNRIYPRLVAMLEILVAMPYGKN